MYETTGSQLDQLLHRVELAQGKQTERFQQIVAGIRATAPDPVKLYIDAVVANDGQLRERALALAAALGMTRQTLEARAAEPIADALLSELKQTNRATYDAAAAAFDAAAKRLEDSHGVAPVTATAEQMADPATAQKVRQAWHDQPALADALRKAYERLIAAASLAGVAVGRTDSATHAPVRILLTCNTDGQHRRVVHEAWADRGHRLGRWGALVAAGVPLRALPAGQIAGSQPYHAPEELVIIGGVTHDPCDYELRGEPMPTPRRALTEREQRAVFNRSVLHG